MDIRRLPATEPAVRRYVEDLWLPYHRDLEAAVDAHALADPDDVDLVAEETEFRLERLEDDTHEIWVAIDHPPEDTDESATAVDISTVDAPLAGYVTTVVNESPAVFDNPDRLVIGDIYVKEPHRGTGLARTLVETAADRAHHYGCDTIRLDVDVDNERARAFYDKLGFEPYRYQLTLDVSGR